jgi:hypothetical protein
MEELIALLFQMMEPHVIMTIDYHIVMMMLPIGKLELVPLKMISMFNLIKSGHQSLDVMVELIVLPCLMMELPVTMIIDFPMLMMILLTGKQELELLRTISIFN